MAFWVGSLNIIRVSKLKGNPPAWPGDSQSLTVPGVANSLRSVNRLKVNGKETVHERVSNSKSYEMGMQISRRVYSEVPAQSAVRAVAELPGRRVPGVGAAEREPDRGRAFTGRSRAHVAVDSAQVCSGAGGGISQRQERDSHCADIWGAAAELCGRALLGPGVLCVDGGARRGGGVPLHSGAGGRGSSARAARVVQEEEVSARLAGSRFDRGSHLGWLLKV